MKFRIDDFQQMEEALQELCRYLDKQNLSEDSIFDSRLISCELLSNVIQHSDGLAFLDGAVNGEFIEITVTSTVRFTPPQKTRCSDVNADCGRGLFLVDAMSERRECTEDGGIKVYIRAEYK